jgi:hypothetical protein
MDTKIFLASKTIWGVVIMALPALLPLAGISFGVDDTAVVNEMADKIFQSVGAVIAVYGRWSATTKLSIK